MLTRFRVRGFKNLLDVDVRFGAFTCFAGENGVGKSNLFDAIRFLSLLAEHQLPEAVQKIRDIPGKSADPERLFTALGSYRAPEMCFTADLIVERNVEDDFGAKATASISSLRYEVAFVLDRQDGVSRLKLVRESLIPIPIGKAKKELGFISDREFRESAITGRRTKSFISTSTTSDNAIIVHQEGHGGRTVPTVNSTRTVLGGVASSEFPTILAVQREMRSWRTLLLDPSAMRCASHYRDPKFIDARGGNLPAAIYRLQQTEDRQDRVRTTIANRLSELLPNTHEMRLVDDPRTETWTIELAGRDKVFHSARALSDGTLRFMALAVLELDSATRGMICIEEPENGIHPTRIADMVTLLQDIAVDPRMAIDVDNPLRQVVVNTHSPLVVQNVCRDDLVYVTQYLTRREGSWGQVAGMQVPLGTWREKLSEGDVRMAPGNMLSYLGRASDSWIAIEIDGDANGQEAEVHAGLGRLK